MYGYGRMAFDFIFVFLTSIFYKKQRILTSTKTFLKLSDFQYSEFLTRVFLKGSMTVFICTTDAFSNISNQDFFKPFQCLDITQVPSE